MNIETPLEMPIIMPIITPLEIPIIVVNKISLDKWLSKSISKSSHDNGYTSHDNENTSYDNGYTMLILSNYLKLWIDSNKDLDRFIDDETFYDEFRNFIYKEYVLPLQKYIYDYEEDELYEHYNMTYSDDINDIFIYYKSFTKSLGSQLLHSKNDNSYPLLQFVYSVCDYRDPYNDNESDMDSPEILDPEDYAY